MTQACRDLQWQRLAVMEDRLMKNKVEILAPAGSFESMKAAVAAGADAVYLGGSRFGARAFADNPDDAQLLEAIDYVHLHGRRIYLTVNTLVKERELSDLIPYLLPCYEQGLDAVIVQDMGVFRVIREAFGDLPIHCSTQMTITNPRSALMLLELGASRIVTARELSLQEIREIVQKTGAELECFVHGALCYSYSGQCLFSSLIGGRSGNRGRCAQTCRLPFQAKKDGRCLSRKEEPYLLSLKDLCTLDLLPDLIEAGVYSLKIEGRMKSPRYTAGVVHIYRKYADRFLKEGRSGYRVEEQDRRQLLSLFDRGGQTDGYYERRSGWQMVVLKEKPAFRPENKELNEYLDQTFVEAVLKEPVTGQVTVREGEASEFSLSCRGTSVTVSGAVVQPARNQPLTKERIEKQIQKTGGTPFTLEALTVVTQGAPFLPLNELNELRRAGFDTLRDELLKPGRRQCQIEKRCDQEAENRAAESLTAENLTAGDPAGADKCSHARFLTVSLEEPEQLPAALAEPSVGELYLDSAAFDAKSWAEAVTRCHAAGKKCFLTLPHIYRDVAERYFSTSRSLYEEAGFDGALVRDWGELPLMLEWGAGSLVVIDYGLYTMNQAAEIMIREMAKNTPIRFTLPLELNCRELMERGSKGRELIVYGRIPVMVTAQCVGQTVGGCSKTPGLLFLKDRMAKEFPVKNHCRFCYNTIYNTSPLSLLKDKKDVDRLSPGSLRLNFTTETPKEVSAVIRAFAVSYGMSGQAKGNDGNLEGAFTRGHFKRGVE